MSDEPGTLASLFAPRCQRCGAPISQYAHMHQCRPPLAAEDIRQIVREELEAVLRVRHTHTSHIHPSVGGPEVTFAGQPYEQQPRTPGT